MTLISVLANLKAAQELLSTTVPDGLDQAAQVADKVSGALKDAAAFLRTLDDVRLPFATDGVTITESPALDPAEYDTLVTELTKLQDECIAACVANEDLGEPGTVKAVAVLPPPLKAVLFQLIAEGIRVLLDRAAARRDR